MTDYTAMLEDLQSTKRELGVLRKKYSTLESDNAILKDSEQMLKRTLSSLKDINSALESQHNNLRYEHEKLLKQYESQISTIKLQIQKKQQNIRDLEMMADNTNLNSDLFRKQIQCAVQAQFVEQLERSQGRVAEIQARFQAVKREKELDREKFQIKVRMLESSIQEMEARHLQEIKDYANRLYQETHRKTTNSQESMLKRLRRELDCLRTMLADKDSQINTLMNEKSDLLQLKSHNGETFNKEKQQLLSKLADYKRQHEERKSEQELQLTRIENKQVRTYETELKKHKEQIADLQHELEIKNTSILQLKNKQKELQFEIGRVEQRYKQKSNSKVEEIYGEMQQLKRQLRSVHEQSQYYKAKYNNVMSNTTASSNTNIISRNNEIHREHNDTISNQNRNTQSNTQLHTHKTDTTNKNYLNQNSEIRKNQILNRQDIENRRENKNVVDEVHQSTTNNKKNIVNQVNIVEERNIKNIRKVYNEDNEEDEEDREEIERKRKGSRSRREKRGKSYESDGAEDYHKGYGHRREDLGESLREESPIQRLKVEKEREKVKEIARRYIDLQKKYDKCKRKLDEANQKVLELIRNKITMLSPPKTINEGFVTNSNGKMDPEAYESQKNRFGSDKMHSTNNFYRSTSPKNTKYYDKSLSFKSKSKTKDLKCLNHDHSVEGHCEHSH